MPNGVLFRSASKQAREDIGLFLEENVAHHLKSGESLPIGAKSDALVAGDELVAPNPPAITTFEITVVDESPTDGPGTKSIEMKLVWDEIDDGDASEEASERSGDEYR